MRFEWVRRSLDNLLNPPPTLIWDLGVDHDKIMHWAVGDDWKTLAAHRMDERIRERTGLPIFGNTLLSEARQILLDAWADRNREG